MSQQGGGARPIIAGWSQGSLSLPGPAALDRGSVDISALLPFPTDAIDNPPLAVTLDIRPVLGSSPSWVISGYPAGTALGARILGFTQVVPGLDLGGFGMGGCRRYVGLDDVGFFLTAPNSTSLPFIVGGIPNNPVFVDVVVFGQSATFSPGVNALGVLTSNGIRLRLGVL
jgi:hypothetical protein